MVPYVLESATAEFFVVNVIDLQFTQEPLPKVKIGPPPEVPPTAGPHLIFAKVFEKFAVYTPVAPSVTLVTFVPI